MALYGLLTDPHGNAEALDAALAELDRRGVDGLLCMGDLVGYNADSDRVVRELGARGAACVAGNHDLIAARLLDTKRCSWQAEHALVRTRVTLASDLRARLRALPRHLIVDDTVLLVHGDLDDPQRYLRTALDIAASAAKVSARMPQVRLCLYGHTHDARVFRVRGGVIESIVPSGVVDVSARPGEIVYVNPGSIDAQRKPPDARVAEFGVLDTSAWTVELLAVPYDAPRTEEKSRAGGFRPGPREHALHLSRRFLGKVKRVITETVREG